LARPAASGAAETLRTYVRLRATLGPGAVIERSASGYVLAVSSDQVDAIRIERLAHGWIVVRDQNVVWHLRVGSAPAQWRNVTKAQVLAQLKTYAGKQVRRIGASM
jgi:hypothetical protein